MDNCTCTIVIYSAWDSHIDFWTNGTQLHWTLGHIYLPPYTSHPSSFTFFHKVFKILFQDVVTRSRRLFFQVKKEKKANRLLWLPSNNFGDLCPTLRSFFDSILSGLISESRSFYPLHHSQVQSHSTGTALNFLCPFRLFILPDCFQSSHFTTHLPLFFLYSCYTDLRLFRSPCYDIWSSALRPRV